MPIVPDPHLNIFHAYRGPALDDGARERQLEDNLTRALAATMTALTDSAARSKLLTALRIPPEDAHAFGRVELQVSTPAPDWPSTRQRTLLVIHGGPRLQVSSIPGSSIRGRADAVFVGRDFLLAVESKLGNVVHGSQLARQMETLGVPPESWTDVTWTDIAKAARSALRGVGPDRDQFILDQFEEYLRVNGFGGLLHEHFSYFTLGPEERLHAEDVKDGIRRVLRTVAEEIRERWSDAWSIKLGNVKLDDPAAWAAVAPDGGNPGRTPHLTIALDASGLSIFANMETKMGHEAFMRAWKTRPGGLLDLLAGLHAGSPQRPPWRFAVKYLFLTERPMHHRDQPAIEIAARAAAALPRDALAALIDGVVRKEPGLAYPEILIERRYEARHVLAEPVLSERLVADAVELEPFFHWVGQPTHR